MEKLLDNATRETLPSEDWGVMLDLCETLNRDPSGARDLFGAILRKLSQRNPNVLLYTLSVLDAIAKNCGKIFQREIVASPVLVALERIVNEKSLADRVKIQVLELVQGWAYEFKDASGISGLIDFYYKLKDAGFRFPPAPSGSAPVRSKATTAAPSSVEEENAQLQMALALSISESAKAATAAPKVKFSVRALYNFAASEPGELSFSKGNIISVTDDSHSDWWRGELDGRVGIFPSNYVERMDRADRAIDRPVESVEPVVDEVDLETYVLQYDAKIDALLMQLAALDPRKDSLTNASDIQDIYQETLRVRPQVIKILSEYNKKKEEIQAMREKWLKASNTYQKLSAERRAYVAPRPMYEPVGYGALPPQGGGYAPQPEYGIIPPGTYASNLPPPQQQQQQQQQLPQQLPPQYSHQHPQAGGFGMPMAAPVQQQQGYLPPQYTPFDPHTGGMMRPYP